MATLSQNYRHHKPGMKNMHTIGPKKTRKPVGMILKSTASPLSTVCMISISEKV